MTNYNNNNTKMKGLLKGLRYISQIFDNEKEPEMEIGFPTDVKHVAHIGWDGPSINSPSWMTEFKTKPPYASSPLNQTRESKDGRTEMETSRRNIVRGRDLPELPKASRRQHSTPMVKGGEGSSGLPESPSRGKSDKARHRRSSKNTSATDSPRHNRRSTDSNSGVENSPEIPKKNRRKKSKDTYGGGSSRTKVINSKVDPFFSPFSDPGPSSEKDMELDCQKPPIFD